MLASDTTLLSIQRKVTVAHGPLPLGCSDVDVAEESPWPRKGHCPTAPLSGPWVQLPADILGDVNRLEFV